MIVQGGTFSQLDIPGQEICVRVSGLYIRLIALGHVKL